MLLKCISTGGMIVGEMNIEEKQFLEAVGTRIRQRREGLNLTQAQLGERCGLHRTFIGSVERGERNVAILNLRAIARALRVSLPELLADEEDASPH
jgi:transcriptional regulator with XRE-family HTH domain